jgi:hypothetical protein
MAANIATAIPEGMVVLFVPDPLEETKSGPQTALTATAIHIAKIASEAHTSLTTKIADHPGSRTAPVGGCEMVDTSHTSFRP